MSLLKALVCILSASALPSLAAKTPVEIQSDLSKQLSSGSQVILTTDQSFKTNFTQRWTIYPPVEPSYSVAAKPKTVQDVQKIVKYASANNVSFLATGGGHGYVTTLSKVKQALDVDLSNFRSVALNSNAKTVTLGGAVRFSDVYDPLYNAGFQIQTGGSSSPGMVGVTLGGGIGPLTGNNGLVIDALVSAQIVTGNGDYLTVSMSSNSDLFWAVRGAGFNFGIVLSATYKVSPTLNNGNVYNADLIFDPEKNGSIFQALSTYQGKHDNKLAISISSSLRNGAPSIAVSAIYFGTQAQGTAAIKPFLDLKPSTSAITMIAWNKLVYTANFGADSFATTKGVLADIMGYQIKNITVPALVSTYNTLMDFMLDNPQVGNSGMWLLEKFGLGVTASIPDDSTAYPWRSAIANGFFEFNLPDTKVNTTSLVDTFLKKIRSQLINGCGNSRGDVYVHYARGDETPEQMYGASKLPKLRSLKKQYDPKGLFNQYNPIR